MDEKMSGRPISGSSVEYGLCKAVLSGTGHSVVAISISKAPDMSNLQNALHKIQLCHPTLRSKLHFNPTTSQFSFLTYPQPFVHIQSSTAAVLKQADDDAPISPFQVILEHELSMDTWSNVNGTREHDMLFATVYEVPSGGWVLVLRLHLLACDRAAAAALVRELVVLYGGAGEVEVESGNNGEMSLGIEDLIPGGKAKKATWVRGINMVSYSISSLSLTNLKFMDPTSPRRSQVVRFTLDLDASHRLIAGCKARGIKLCGALVAAGLIAAHSSNKTKKYGVVTMVDCRSLLHPPLSDRHFGFYHSAIMNTHTLKGGDPLWNLAEKCYTAFACDKKKNKHLSDMADLTFLMTKAIDNPSLTPSSTLRTSLLSVFEDTQVDVYDQNYAQTLGFDDCMRCISIHGVGPSISIFDTIRDGRLDLVYEYVAPLHSRDQIQELADKMKTLFMTIDG